MKDGVPLIGRLNILILLALISAAAQICYAQGQQSNANKTQAPRCFCVPPPASETERQNNLDSSRSKSEPFDCEKAGGIATFYKASEVDEEAVITFKPGPSYSAEAEENHVTGVVELYVIFCPAGFVSDIKVRKGLPDGLTQQAMIAAKKMKFKPAKKNGVPVAQRAIVEFYFNKKF
ncbi:MAG TPA: energy transducer TonB [Pyrinomonadaceae bacterium]|nr:energy transducer TonB [Pyrinomonadaceae bacterium]